MSEICHFPARRATNEKADPPPPQEVGTNLNALVVRPNWNQKGKVQTYFSTRGIMRKIRQCLQRKDTPYVCGCLETCTHRPTLADLRNKRGVSLVVSDRTARLEYTDLPRFRGDTVRTVPFGSMHYNFLVGLNEKRRSIWVIFFTLPLGGNMHDLHTATFVQDEKLSAFYAEEYLRVHKVSVPLTVPAAC